MVVENYYNFFLPGDIIMIKRGNIMSTKLGDAIKSLKDKMTPEKMTLIKKIIKWVVIGLLVIGAGIGIYFGVTSRHFKEIFTSSDPENTEELAPDNQLDNIINKINVTVFGKKPVKKKDKKK